MPLRDHIIIILKLLLTRLKVGEVPDIFLNTCGAQIAKCVMQNTLSATSYSPVINMTGKKKHAVRKW